MSKIDDLIKKYCPDGVDYRELGRVLDYIQPTKYIVNSTTYNNSFNIPVLTAGQTFILGYTNETEGIYMATKEEPVMIFDDFTTSNHWVDFNFKVKSSAMKILMLSKDTNCNFKYIYYAIKCITYKPEEHARQWISNYSKIKIPIPPLQVQEEIVRILDKFTFHTAELEAELEKRKHQYQFYRDELLSCSESSDESKWIRLGDLTNLITKGTTPKKYEEDGVKFIKTEAFLGSQINKNKLSYINEIIHLGELKRSILKENDILFTIAGATIGKCAKVEKEFLPANTNQALAIIRLKDNVNLKFVMFCLQSNMMKLYIEKSAKGSAQPNLNLQQISDFLILFHSKEKQEKIVAILDKFDKLTNDLQSGLPAEIEKRKQQYEYYRNKLLTFKEKAIQ